MSYRDPNLEAPDIARYFPHLHSRVMPHSMGQEVLSDWADKDPDDPVFGIYRVCGFLNYDEAAIVYQCAKQIGGYWLDVGCHTGWTALHMARAGAWVVGIDPMLANEEFKARTQENISRVRMYHKIRLMPVTSRMLFGYNQEPVITATSGFDGVLIDGDHCWGEPEYDAEQSFEHLNDRGVILLHDFIGGPVTKAVTWLMAQGMKCRVYCSSSQLLAVCWRGEFTPPDYTPDPAVDWLEYRTRVTDFNFQECV